MNDFADGVPRPAHVTLANRTDCIDLRASLRATLATAVVLLPLAVGLEAGFALVAILVSAAAPLTTYVLLNRHSADRTLLALPGLFCTAAFFVFFATGAISWSMSDGATDVGYLRVTSGSAALATVSALAAILTAYVVGERVGTPRISPAGLIASADDVLVPAAHLLFVLAACGTLLTVKGIGGWSAAASLLRPHNKLDLEQVAGSPGITLWSIFALPAVIAVGLVLADRTRKLASRRLAGFELAILAYFALALFGSRLVLTLGAVGIVAGRFASGGRRPRFRTLVVGAVVLLLLSGFVLAQRSAPTPTQTRTESTLNTLSYGVFDVSLAALADRDRLRPDYINGRRLGRIALSAVPILGPRQGTLADDRVDVMTVQAIGRPSQAKTTGLPPSLPTFSLIAFGLAVSMLAAAVGGYMTGRISGALSRRSFCVGGLFFGLWSAFVFNVFKDGDLPVDAAAEVKRWLYVGVVIVFARLVCARTVRD